MQLTGPRDGPRQDRVGAPGAAYRPPPRPAPSSAESTPAPPPGSHTGSPPANSATAASPRPLPRKETPKCHLTAIRGAALPPGASRKADDSAAGPSDAPRPPRSPRGPGHALSPPRRTLQAGLSRCPGMMLLDPTDTPPAPEQAPLLILHILPVAAPHSPAPHHPPSASGPAMPTAMRCDRQNQSLLPLRPDRQDLDRPGSGEGWGRTSTQLRADPLLAQKVIFCQ